jgi:hypothetical protein
MTAPDRPSLLEEIRRLLAVIEAYQGAEPEETFGRTLHTCTPGDQAVSNALAKTPRLLRAALQILDQQEFVSAKYYELLYQVACKHPNETRHETALRYIRQAENQPSGGPVSARPLPPTVEPPVRVD